MIYELSVLLIVFIGEYILVLFFILFSLFLLNILDDALAIAMVFILFLKIKTKKGVYGNFMKKWRFKVE